MRDITTIDEIRRLVDAFYEKVRKDKVIGPIFIGAIGDQWPAHLDRMYRFWQTVLLEEHTYYGSPFAPHAKMPIESKHFESWISLWKATVDELFEGPKATEAKWRADKMAGMFLSKLNYYRDNPNVKPIL